MIKIYHNPRCRKSRETLQLLHEKGAAPEVVEYLVHPPSREELEELLSLLKISPEQLVRKGEPEYKEHFKGKQLSDSEWLDAFVRFPKLMERPIVVKNGKAVIGRPPSNVLTIL